MLVYYIGNGQGGCYYYRCYLPLLHNGWSGEYISMFPRKKTSEELAKGTMMSDIIVFQRPDDVKKLEMAKMLKKAGKKIVFENDDTYSVLDNDMNFKEEFLRQNEFLIDFMKIADLVTTTTEQLADEYRKHNDNVVVLPNFIDTDDWDEPIKNKSDKIRIGLVGSVLHNGDYKHIQLLLKDLSDRVDIQLVLFGLKGLPAIFEERFKEEFNFWNSLNIEWKESVPNYMYPETLNELELDMMLIPRKETYFNKCKSNCKYLEASMLEIPVVAEKFEGSPYMNDKVLLAHTLSEWREQVYKLIDDKVFRVKLGKEAKAEVIKNYNIEDKANLWKKTYQKLV